MSTRTISSRLIPANQRMGFLPKHFGKHMLVFENWVYTWMKKLVPAYNGGHWDFYETTDNAPYMVLKTKAGSSRLISPYNGFDDTMTDDAIGITVSLFVLGQLANHTEDDAHITQYHDLRQFALEHPESQKILRAID